MKLKTNLISPWTERIYEQMSLKVPKSVIISFDGRVHAANVHVHPA